MRIIETAPLQSSTLMSQAVGSCAAVAVGSLIGMNAGTGEVASDWPDELQSSEEKLTFAIIDTSIKTDHSVTQLASGDATALVQKDSTFSNISHLGDIRILPRQLELQWKAVVVSQIKR